MELCMRRVRNSLEFAGYLENSRVEMARHYGFQPKACLALHLGSSRSA